MTTHPRSDLALAGLLFVNTMDPAKLLNVSASFLNKLRTNAFAHIDELDGDDEE
jgi:hypothetical protein